MSDDQIREIISSVIDEKMDELLEKIKNMLEENKLNNSPKEVKKKKSRKGNWKDNLSSSALDDYKDLPSFRNAFFMFRQENSDDIKDQKEEGERHASTAGRLWGDMDGDDKKEYEEMSKESEKVFSEALITWVEQYSEYEQYLPAAKKKLLKKYSN